MLLGVVVNHLDSLYDQPHHLGADERHTHPPEDRKIAAADLRPHHIVGNELPTTGRKKTRNARGHHGAVIALKQILNGSQRNQQNGEKCQKHVERNSLGHHAALWKNSAKRSMKASCEAHHSQSLLIKAASASRVFTVGRALASPSFAMPASVKKSPKKYRC